MRRASKLIGLICILVAAPLMAADDGWISLFNGEDLSGWKVSENPSSVKVEDGMLVMHGPRAHAFFLGDDGKAEFKNFHLKAEVMTTPGSNSGIYFHTKYLERGWPDRGYEAQVNNTHTDRKKTGGLYSVEDNFTAPAQDNEWFTYEIVVNGKHIVLKIDGKTITDYTEPDDLDRPERQLSTGRIALQAHDPNSRVLFRNLKIKPLPDA